MRAIIKRLASYIAVILLQASAQRQSVSSRAVLLRSEEDQVLYGYSYLNISGSTMGICLERCLANCLCMSFQICNTKCQLCSTNRHLTPAALRHKANCTSFEFNSNNAKEEDINSQQCNSGCGTILNCCWTSQPCLNGGTCLFPSQNDKKRFRCKCPDGYHGDRCGIKLCLPGYTGETCENHVTSCRDYAKGHRTQGNYTLFDANTNTTYDVYCNFDDTSAMAWTLVRSYSRVNKQVSPFIKNTPINEETPNWVSYSLSKSRMQSILQDSTKWRTTCNFELYVSGMRTNMDYIQANIATINILTYHIEGCVQVEYIRIGPKQGSNVTVYLTQTTDVTLHSLYKHPPNKNYCTFVPTDEVTCKAGPEKEKKDIYFGYYSCPNAYHQCSNLSTSTTQTWFGGKYT